MRARIKRRDLILIKPGALEVLYAVSMNASGKSSLAALVGVVLIGMTGFGLFLPIFPFLALHLHATPTAATIAMGAYSFGQLLASPLWGRLSDRIGRKPILVSGLIGCALSYLWVAQADSVQDLFAARLFGGLMAGNVGAAFAAAADLSDDRTRARNMGLLGAAVGLGFIAGPALGAFLIGGEPARGGFTQVCMISAALASLAGLAAFLFFRETRASFGVASTDTQRGRREFSMLASRPALLRFVIVMLLAIAAQAVMESVFGLWADVELHWGPREVGWTLAALGAVAVLLQGGLAGKAARILGERKMLLAGLALVSVGLGGLAIARDLTTTALSLFVLALGMGFTTPALNALIAAQAREGDRGAVMGLSQSASALGRVIGPLVAGALFETLGPGAPLFAGALVALCALLVAADEERWVSSWLRATTLPRRLRTSR